MAGKAPKKKTKTLLGYFRLGGAGTGDKSSSSEAEDGEAAAGSGAGGGGQAQVPTQPPGPEKDPAVFVQTGAGQPRTEAEKIELLRGMWQPPEGYPFPMRQMGGQKRSFQSAWLKHYKWLRYSHQTEGAFCCWCMSFESPCGVGKGGNEKQRSFTRVPWTNYKKGKGDLDHHAEMAYHKTAAGKAAGFLQALDTGKTVLDTVKSKGQADSQKRREYLHRLFEAIIWLGRQNVALRGDATGSYRGEQSDSANRVCNYGNYTELLRLLGNRDATFAAFASKLDKTTTYQSPLSQNQMINLIGDQMKKAVLTEIIQGSDGYFCILADETTDASHKEQLSLVVRFVKREGKGVRVYERFLCFTALSDLTAESVTNVITEEIGKAGLEIGKLIGIGTDGASSMAGAISGVQTRLRQLVPTALWTHCVSHTLMLCVVDSISQLAGITSELSAVIAFVNGSPKRRESLAQVVRNHQFTNKVTQARQVHLVSLCKTRWVENEKAYERFYSLYEPILLFLDSMADKDSDPKARSKAESYYTFLTKGETLLKVSILSHLSGLLLPVTAQLQSVNLDLVACLTLIDGLKTQIRAYHTPVAPTALVPNPEPFPLFRDMWNTADALAIASGFQLAIPRRAARQQNRTDRYQFYTEKLWRPVHLTLEAQLGTRFSQHHATVYKLSGLIPPLMSKVTKQDVQNAIMTYESHLGFPSDSTVSVELDLWKTYWTTGAGSSIQPMPANALDTMDKTDPNVFPIINRTLQFFATLACSTASVERSFSYLKLIKSHVRSSMGEERLVGLAHLSINRDMELNIDDLVKRFDVISVAQRNKMKL